MLFLKKVWNFIRHYWYIPFVLFVIIYFLFRGNAETVKKILKIKTESYKKEKEALEAIAKEKAEAKKKADAIHKAALAELEAKKELDLSENKEATKKEIEKIKKEFKDDPEGLAKKFADEFGLDMKGLMDE